MHIHSIPTNLYINSYFPGEPGLAGSSRFSSSTCSGKEPMGKDACFCMQDVLPITEPKHWMKQSTHQSSGLASSFHQPLPGFTPSHSVTALWPVIISHPVEGRRLSWHEWLPRWFAHPKTVTHPSTNRSRHSNFNAVTSTSNRQMVLSLQFSHIMPLEW